MRANADTVRIAKWLVHPLVLAFFFSTAAHFPVLHHLLHLDGADPRHECAILWFASEKLTASEKGVAANPPAPLFNQPVTPAGRIPVPASRYRLPPSRGPPCLSIFSA